jgi:hypothetical protein
MSLEPIAQENEQMAKRENALFKKTTRDPEAIEGDQLDQEQQDQPDLFQGRVIDPEEYDGLDDAPPEYYDVKPLSVNERRRRAELENVITDNFGAFYAVGCALREIQQKQLYRDTHKTFSLYCKELWEMARQQAYRLIDAAGVVEEIRQISENLSPIGDKNAWIPKNESQARALLKFKDDPEAIRTIVTEAVQTAPDGKITAAHLKKTARNLHLENVRKAVVKTRQRSNQSPKISEDFRRAFNHFLDQINIERANDYKHTDQSEVIRHVRIILEALEAEL